MADKFEFADEMLAQVTGGFDSDEIGREFRGMLEAAVLELK